jgi:hypothetical protein
VNRIHQEPASPYTLDVMDELGLMVIDESAILRASKSGREIYREDAQAFVLQ